MLGVDYICVCLAWLRYSLCPHSAKRIQAYLNLQADTCCQRHTAFYSDRITAPTATTDQKARQTSDTAGQQTLEHILNSAPWGINGHPPFLYVPRKSFYCWWTIAVISKAKYVEASFIYTTNLKASPAPEPEESLHIDEAGVCCVVIVTMPPSPGSELL